MNNEFYIQELLDEYVFRQRSSRDIAAELSRLGLQDASAELELHRAAVTALQRGRVHQQVLEVHRQFLQQQKAPQPNTATQTRILTMKKNLKWMLYAAVLVLLIGGSWLAYKYSTIDNEKLYAEIYQPYHVNTERAVIHEIKPHQMVQQFRNKEFTAVIATFRELSSPNNREQFLAAMAYQETGDHTQAIGLLEELVKKNRKFQNRLYNDEAEFYLALNYLKVKKKSAALTLFRKIYEDPGHTFHERISKASLRKMRWLHD